MAYLKDTVIVGELSVTDTVRAATACISTLRASAVGDENDSSAGINGQVLYTDGNHIYWDYLPYDDAGVTEVGFYGQNGIVATAYTSVNGSALTGNKITTTGVGVIGLDTAYGDTINPYAAKPANYVLAGRPDAGADLVPTFRALVAADIPSITKSKISDFPTNLVTYTLHSSVSVAGTVKNTYTYTPTAIYAPNGLIMGGTAAAAGLVTRGICGVSTPDATTGACTKENLYLNYDGNNTNNPNGRGVIINAGSSGTDLGNGVYSYCAVRGDAMKAWVEAKGYLTSYVDTKNTAGSTDISTKIFLIGASSQAANPQTYSDNEVYATDGKLSAKSHYWNVSGTEKAHIDYNSSTLALDFIFN